MLQPLYCLGKAISACCMRGWVSPRGCLDAIDTGRIPDLIRNWTLVIHLIVKWLYWLSCPVPLYSLMSCITAWGDLVPVIISLVASLCDELEKMSNQNLNCCLWTVCLPRCWYARRLLYVCCSTWTSTFTNWPSDYTDCCTGHGSIVISSAGVVDVLVNHLC